MKNTSPGKKSAAGQKSKSRPGVKTAANRKFQRAEQKKTSTQTIQDSELRYLRPAGTNSGLVKARRELGKGGTRTVYLPVSRERK